MSWLRRQRPSPKTSPVGLPIPTFSPDDDTPVELPETACRCAGKGLNVTVGFSTTAKVMSRIIRWVTRGSVSHAWIAYNDHTLGQRMVMQAEAWCYEVRPWERWKRENIWVAEFKLVDRQPHAALQKRAKDIGLKYDWRAGFFVGVVAWVKRWFKAGLSFRLSRSPRRLMCSEAVVRFLKDLQIACVKNLDEELTSPVELFDAVRCSMDFIPVRRSGA